MAPIQSEVDFSDSDFLVSQMGRKARFSQLRRKADTSEAVAPAQPAEPPEEKRVPVGRPLVGKLLVLIPLVVMAWFLLANR